MRSEISLHPRQASLNSCFGGGSASCHHHSQDTDRASIGSGDAWREEAAQNAPTALARRSRTLAEPRPDPRMTAIPSDFCIRD